MTWSPWSSTRSSGCPTLPLTLRPVIGLAVIWLDHRAPVMVKAKMNFFWTVGGMGVGQNPKRYLSPDMQSNIYCLTISRNNNAEVLVLFLINNPIIWRRKKLFAVFTKIFSAHRAAHLVFPVQWMEKTHSFKSPLCGGSSSAGWVLVSGKTMCALGPAPRGKPDLASSWRFSWLRCSWPHRAPLCGTPASSEELIVDTLNIFYLLLMQS